MNLRCLFWLIIKIIFYVDALVFRDEDLGNIKIEYINDEDKRPKTLTMKIKDKSSNDKD